MKQTELNCFPVQELQLIYKQKFKPSERPKITNSQDCYRVLLSTWNVGVMGFIAYSGEADPRSGILTHPERRFLFPPKAAV
jgi:hypothetical protein